MIISPLRTHYEIDQELKNLGFRHHCFLSYPHGIPDARKYVKQFQNDIQKELKNYFSNASIFLDENEIHVGDYWEKTLAAELCKSVSLVAFCGPQYFSPDHKWCGHEWAAMHALGNKRLAGNNFSAIIPVIVRRPKIFPKVVQEIQYYDVSDLLTIGRRYHLTTDYGRLINQIVDKIVKIAEVVAIRKLDPGLEEFHFPLGFPFADYAFESSYPRLGVS